MSKKSLCESFGINEDNLRKRKEFIQLGNEDGKVLLKLKLGPPKSPRRWPSRLKNFPVFEVIHLSCVRLGLA